MSQRTIEHARKLEDLATSLQRAGRYHAAEDPLLTAIGLWKLLRGPNDLEVLNDEMCLAVSYRRRGDVDLAIPILERVAAQFARTHGDPEAPYYRRLALNNLGISYRYAGRFREARFTLETCLALIPFEADSESELHAERARVLDNLATIALHEDDVSLAERYAREGLSAWLLLRGDETLDVAVSAGNLGTALMRQGCHGEARVQLERSVHLTETLAGPTHPALPAALNLLGELEVRVGNVCSAFLVLNRSLTLCQELLLSEDHPDVVAAESIMRAASAP